jgi:putative transposase
MRAQAIACRHPPTVGRPTAGAPQDCSKEVVQIAVDTSIPTLYVTRVLDQVTAERGLPKVIRTDNGPEFAGRTMQTWAASNGVELRFIQPGKPVQNA